MIKISRGVMMARGLFRRNFGGFGEMGTKASGLLKHSRFSEYMGLAEELRKLEKEEEKEEKREVRSSNFILVVCVAGFCSLGLFISADPVSSIRLLLLKKQIQLTMTKNQENKQKLMNEMIGSIKTFLEKRPHDYLEFIGSLKSIGRCSEDMQAKESLDMLKQVYLLILERNYKAVQDKEVINALTTLIERCFVLNKIMSVQLLYPLLVNGTTKQIYLATKCITKWNQFSQLSPQTIQKIHHNLKHQASVNHTYFSSIFEKVPQSDLPHLLTKQHQQLAWQTYIKAQFNLI